MPHGEVARAVFSTCMAVVEDADIQDGLHVRLPSGAKQPVLTTEEAEYLTTRIALYLDHNAFTNISDLQDLDKVVVQELLIYRDGVWLGRGLDYDGMAFDEKDLRARWKETQTELRQLKKNLGIDRPAREKAKGEGSIPHYWANIQARAKAFGIMRCRQLDKGIELSQQLTSLIQVHDNATERERDELHCTERDIIEWVREVFIPEFAEIDAYFREHEQSIWVRDL